jgi:hypothetical protein
MIKQILDDGWLRYLVELCPACQEAITQPGGQDIAARALSTGHCDHEYTGKLVPIR